MTTFYLICALVVMLMMLLNFYLAPEASKLTPKQTVWCFIIALIPFINAMFIVVALMAAYRDVQE